jgi:uncharacterized protein (DUF2141 family)
VERNAVSEARCPAAFPLIVSIAGPARADRDLRTGLSPHRADDNIFSSACLGVALIGLCTKTAALMALALLSTLTAAPAQPAGKLSVTVTGVRNGDGVVRCALFNSPAAFPKIGQEWRGVVAPIRAGAASCVFSGVPAGTYAVAFFHAEHNETQLATGMFGKPVQGYGFSNNAAGSFGPPNFSAAAFRYDGGNMMLQGSLSY